MQTKCRYVPIRIVIVTIPAGYFFESFWTDANEAPNEVFAVVPAVVGSRRTFVDVLAVSAVRGELVTVGANAPFRENNKTVGFIFQKEKGENIFTDISLPFQKKQCVLK